MTDTGVDVCILTPDHRYVLSNGRQVDGVSSILRAAGIRPAPYVGTGRHGDAMARALKRGSEVHRLTRAIDETYDELDALDDAFDPADFSVENANYVAAYHHFLKLSGYKPTSWEKVLYNPVLDYAGRCDGVGWLGNDRVLIDRKTDRTLHRSVWLQLCFYRMAWDACYPTEKVDRTYAVKLNADTTFELVPNPIERADNFCVAAVWIARWHKMIL